jgi:hypothetical protein
VVDRTGAARIVPIGEAQPYTTAALSPARFTADLVVAVFGWFGAIDGADD